ncbi:MAG TPA: hypothetical protein VFP61_07195, partial [Acidimicrobiales bacterium]|nr:hypothetical protein [Acidimicrobiales bacterium]
MTLTSMDVDVVDEAGLVGADEVVVDGWVVAVVVGAACGDPPHPAVARASSRLRAQPATGSEVV